MKFMKSLVLTWCVSATLLASVGCQPADEGCVADSECREGRVCVAGQCTGDIPLDDNDGAVSNNDQTNSDENAETNSDENSETNNGSAGNNTIGSPCAANQDCDNELACGLSDDGTLQCAVPWTCELFDRQGGEDFCAAYWECEGMPAFVECAFDVDGNGDCLCVSGDGDDREVIASRDICESEETLADFVNQNCGWYTTVAAAATPGPPNNNTTNNGGSNIGEPCTTGAECGDDLCLVADDGTRMCMAAWPCKVVRSIVDEQTCAIHWECDDRPDLVFDCMPTSDGSSNCMCIEDDIVVSAPRPADVCDDTDRVETYVHTLCDWRVRADGF